MADDVLRFGKIEILEWLRPGEMKTGRDLFDEVEPMGIASMPAIGAQYRQVWTRAEFLAALARSRMNSAPPACCRCSISKPTAASAGSVFRSKKASPSPN